MNNRNHNNTGFANVSRIKNIAFYFSASIVSFWLANYPFGKEVKDYGSFINHMSTGILMISNTRLGDIDGIFKFILSEPLWFLISGTFGIVFGNELALSTIIFISSFILMISMYNLTDRKLLVLPLFLFNFSLLTQYIVHIQNGLAISIFFGGLMVARNRRGFLVFLSPFLHSSMFFAVIYRTSDKLFSFFMYRWSVRILCWIFTIFGFILIIPFVANLSGDPRGFSFSFSTAINLTGLNALFWICMLPYYILFSNNGFYSRGIIFGIIFYLFSLPFLDFGMRIFSSFLPFAIIAIKEFRGRYQLLYIFIFFAYGIGLWMVGGDTISRIPQW